VNLKVLDMLDVTSMNSLPGYHLIVSNPPYVSIEEKKSMNLNVLAFEPHEALFVPDEDPLVYCRTIGAIAYQHLIRPGALYVEINERFGSEIKGILLSQGFDRVEVLRDLAGKDRFVRAEAKHTMADTSYWMVDKNLPEISAAQE